MPSGFGSQQCDDALHVFLATKPVQRDTLKHLLAHHIQQAAGHFGGEEAGADAVHVDVVLAPFGSQGPGEVDVGTFGGVVGDSVHAFGVTGQSGNGGGGDDLAGLAGNHAATAHFAGEEEGGVDVQVHHLVPGFVRVVFG